MIRRTLTPLLLLLALAVVVPATASASSYDILEDCQDGRLDKSYSPSDLREALRDLPVDLDEYSNCREVIRSAQQGVRGPGGSGPKQGDTGPIVGAGPDTGSGTGAATPGIGQAAQDAAGDSNYGPLQPGEGGLPRNGDVAANPLDFSATPEERKGFEEARAVDPSLVAAKAGAHPKTAGADLPNGLIVLLALTGGAILATVIPRLRDLVVRRSA